MAGQARRAFDRYRGWPRWARIAAPAAAAFIGIGAVGSATDSGEKKPQPVRIEKSVSATVRAKASTPQSTAATTTSSTTTIATTTTAAPTTTTHPTTTTTRVTTTTLAPTTTTTFYDASAGATAQCSDGTYSYSEHRSGTCSHHGGVARWINPPPS